MLEAHGLSVMLANSSQARQLAGRPKTDRLDAQWLARLAEMGLLRPSLVQTAEIRELREYAHGQLTWSTTGPGPGSGWRSCWRAPCAS